MIDIALLFAKCLKMYLHFFAFAFKVCIKCYYDPKIFSGKIINMGITKTQKKVKSKNHEKTKILKICIDSACMA
jgi:hypothetical protein